MEKVHCLVSEVFGESGGGGVDGVEGVDYGGCPLSRDPIESAVRRASGKTKNGSAPGPDGTGYRLIKAVRDTRLGGELIEDIVDKLAQGVIPPAWREMWVLFIPKPGRDLTLAKYWRPLNLINCVGKLGEKVMADRIQDIGGDQFHHLQFGSIKGRSVVDVFYRSVVKARRCIDEGGDVGWGFWDVKGGFQNIVEEEVVDCLAGVEGTRGLCRWVRQFVAGQTFEVCWDGKVRGVGSSSIGVLQGYLLSPVLLLVWMATILREMERRVVEEVPGVSVEFRSYVYDLHCGLYIGRRGVGNLDTIEWRERMGDLLDRVSKTLKEVATSAKRLLHL